MSATSRFLTYLLSNIYKNCKVGMKYPSWTPKEIKAKDFLGRDRRKQTKSRNKQTKVAQ